MEPVLCPLCMLPTLERLLANAEITAKVDHENRDHSIVAYRCTEYNHLFFLPNNDLNTSDSSPRHDEIAAATTCPICRGTGFDDTKQNFCSTCDGTGEISVRVQVPMHCPFCTRSEIERLFGRVIISAKMDGKTSVLKGLQAFRCVENRHMFLMAVSDIERFLKAA